MAELAQPSDASAKDEYFLQAIEQCDDYLAAQHQATELLKQGFLKLTMAKMNLPAHVVGELSYKDYFESALCVVEESDGTLRTVKSSDKEHTREVESTESVDGSALKRRKDKGRDADPPTAKAPESPRPGAEDAAIMWFSSLPPQNLRLAQKHFRSALLALLVSAASTRKIHSAIHKANHKSTND